MKNADKPITPLYGVTGKLFLDSGDQLDTDYIRQCKPLIGLTKREAFTMAAMQGLLSNEGWTGTKTSSANNNPEAIAKLSVLIADQILKILET